MASFWFGPTPSGRVAIASCAILGGDARWDGSFGSELAAEALSAHRHWFGEIRPSQGRPAEASLWARLFHTSLAIDGGEAFHLSHGFMQRLRQAAALRGLACFPCAPHWAAVDSRLDLQSWPDGEAKSLLCRAELEWSMGREHGGGAEPNASKRL